jgi:hypothetical protein
VRGLAVSCSGLSEHALDERCCVQSLQTRAIIFGTTPGRFTAETFFFFLFLFLYGTSGRLVRTWELISRDLLLLYLYSRYLDLSLSLTIMIIIVSLVQRTLYWVICRYCHLHTAPFSCLFRNGTYQVSGTLHRAIATASAQDKIE